MRTAEFIAYVLCIVSFAYMDTQTPLSILSSIYKLNWKMNNDVIRSFVYFVYSSTNGQQIFLWQIGGHPDYACVCRVSVRRRNVYHKCHSRVNQHYITLSFGQHTCECKCVFGFGRFNMRQLRNRIRVAADEVLDTNRHIQTVCSAMKKKKRVKIL